MSRTVELPPVIHLGAEHGVTGSCHLLQTNGLNILIDCGMAQGGDRAAPIDEWPIKPSEVHYLFLTHSHIDHIGRIPDLIRNGFQGEIITTHPTKILILPMLEDAMSFSGMSDKEIAALTHSVGELTWGFEYGVDFDLKNGLRFKFRRAGHILGSAFIRIESEDPPWSMIFSGDLGAKGKPILPDPDPPDTCDLLFLESTYGDTIHEGREDRILQLGSVLSRALSDGGKVYIPSFALGRTQELIYDLDRLTQVPEFRKKFPLLRPDSKIPIFLDSPLGMKLTEIYTLLHPYWDKEAKQILQSGNNPLDLDQLYTAAKHGEHLKLLEMPGPCIIIAGSGMCTGGRIIDHLKTGLEDPRNDIVFVGYQGEGTLGRQIIKESRKENGFASINGMEVSIKAGVHVLMGYSGHADQNDLVDWVQSMPSLPGMIKLLHGEESAKMALAVRLRSHGYQVN